MSVFAFFKKDVKTLRRFWLFQVPRLCTNLFEVLFGYFNKLQYLCTRLKY